VAAPPVTALPVAGRPEPQGPHDLHSGAPVVPSYDRRSVRRWLPLVLVALLVAVLGTAYLSQLSDQSGTTAGTTTKPKATGASKTSAQPSAASPAPSRVAAAPAPNSDKKLDNFVKSYYSDVTKDTGRTWGRLSPTMQQYAGGRAGYDGFWRTIARVGVNQTRPNSSAAKSVVNLTFIRNNGTTSTETHQLAFDTRGGGYLIDSDKLLG